MLNVKKTLSKIITNVSSTLDVKKGTGAQNWCVLRNGIVEFYIEITGASWSSGWNTIATLPSGYEPIVYYDLMGKDNTNDTACSCKVTATGDVQVYKTNSLSAAVRVHSVHFAKLGGVVKLLKNAISNLCRKGVAVC